MPGLPRLPMREGQHVEGLVTARLRGVLVALGAAHGVERLPAAAQGVPPLAVSTTSLTRRSASRLHVPASLCGCTSCTSALGCGATHGAVARVCCGRQATGVTPTVHKVRFSSERGRCVTHWRSDGTTAPEPEHRGRERVLLA